MNQSFFSLNYRHTFKFDAFIFYSVFCIKLFAADVMPTPVIAGNSVTECCSPTSDCPAPF